MERVDKKPNKFLRVRSAGGYCRKDVQQGFKEMFLGLRRKIAPQPVKKL